MHKLLIVDKSHAFCQLLEEQMCKLYEVHSCSEGVRAVELVKQLNPDVLVVDLCIPGLDGIGVLQAIRNAGYRPMVLALSNYFSDYTLSMLETLSVSFIAQKPCTVLNVAARLYEFQAFLNDPKMKTWQVQDEACDLLLSLGISMCGKNFSCIHSALVYLTENENRFFTKELYPEIALRCGGSANRVEKAIRDAVVKAWRNRDDRIWQLFFTYGNDGQIPCPSNSEFLSRLANYLGRKMRAG